MIGERAILVTVTGPGGHADIGVRSDATPRVLADVLASVLGLGGEPPAAEHRSPPRPGVPQGQRTLLRPDTTLAEAGVVDGDLIVFGPRGRSQPGQPSQRAPSQPGEQHRNEQHGSAAP